MCRALYRRLFIFSVLALAGGFPAAAQGQSASQRPTFWGFTGPWDAASDRSIRTHGGKLNAVINGWITIDSATAQPVIPSPYPDTLRPRNGTPERMAIVTSWHGERFHAEPIRRLGRDPQLLARTAGAIARYAQAMRYSGLVLDFETLERADLPALLRVSGAIADSARAHRVRTIAIAIPATDTAAYPARPLLGAVDALVAADGSQTVTVFRDAQNPPALIEAAGACRAYERLEARGHLDAMLARYGTLRQYLPAFLALPFQAGAGSETLVRAIDVPRQLKPEFSDNHPCISW